MTCLTGPSLSCPRRGRDRPSSSSCSAGSRGFGPGAPRRTISGGITSPTTGRTDPSDYVGADEYNRRVASIVAPRPLPPCALVASGAGHFARGWRKRSAWPESDIWTRPSRIASTWSSWSGLSPMPSTSSSLRDPRATISSMMEGWKDPMRFAKEALRSHLLSAGSWLTHWCYPAPSGWKDHLHESLEEVCAWSWCRHIEAADRGLKAIPRERKIVVRLRGPRRQPGRVAKKTWRLLRPGLGRARRNLFAEERPLSRTTVSAPDATKWMRLHGAEISRVLPHGRGRDQWARLAHRVVRSRNRRNERALLDDEPQPDQHDRAPGGLDSLPVRSRTPPGHRLQCGRGLSPMGGGGGDSCLRRSPSRSLASNGPSPSYPLS